MLGRLGGLRVGWRRISEDPGSSWEWLEWYSFLVAHKVLPLLICRDYLFLDLRDGLWESWTTIKKMQVGNPRKNCGSGSWKWFIKSFKNKLLLPPTPLLHPLPSIHIPSLHPFRHPSTIRKSFSLPSAKTKDAATLLRLADLDEDPNTLFCATLGWPSRLETWTGKQIWKIPQTSPKLELLFLELVNWSGQSWLIYIYISSLIVTYAVHAYTFNVLYL